MNKLRLAFAFIMVASLSGCIIVDGNVKNWDEDFSSSDWEHQQKDNREKISNLNLGDSYDMVKALMGSPSFTDALDVDGEQYNILYYRTHHKHSDGDTTRDETTPLIFKNKKLMGWGKDVLNKIL